MSFLFPAGHPTSFADNKGCRFSSPRRKLRFPRPPHFTLKTGVLFGLPRRNNCEFCLRSFCVVGISNSRQGKSEKSCCTKFCVLHILLHKRLPKSPKIPH